MYRYPPSGCSHDAQVMPAPDGSGRMSSGWPSARVETRASEVPIHAKSHGPVPVRPNSTTIWWIWSPTAMPSPIQYQCDGSVGVYGCCTVLNRSPDHTTYELLRNGTVVGRLPSGFTGPRKVSEKMNTSRPSASRVL